MLSLLKKALPCPDELDTLVLRQVQPILGDTPHNYTVYWSNDYSTDYWYPQFAAWQQKIDNLRTWNQTQKGCAKKDYEKWISYYEHRLNEARNEVQSHTVEKEHADYAAKNAAKNQRVNAYAKSCAIPVPPKKF